MKKKKEIVVPKNASLFDVLIAGLKAMSPKERIQTFQQWSSKTGSGAWVN